jgi:hypothetical protein
MPDFASADATAASARCFAERTAHGHFRTKEFMRLFNRADSSA